MLIKELAFLSTAFCFLLFAVLRVLFYAVYANCMQLPRASPAGDNYVNCKICLLSLIWRVHVRSPRLFDFWYRTILLIFRFIQSIPPLRFSSYLSILVDGCCQDYLTERRARHIIDGRALSWTTESLILPMGIGEPLSLSGEIEIEYESKGRARERGVKGTTRIRRMRRKNASFKKRKTRERERD